MGKDLYISHARREPWVRRDVTRRGFPFWQESKLHVDMRTYTSSLRPWSKSIPILWLLLQNSARNAEEYHGVTPLNIAGWHCGNKTPDSF